MNARTLALLFAAHLALCRASKFEYGSPVEVAGGEKLDNVVEDTTSAAGHMQDSKVAATVPAGAAMIPLSDRGSALIDAATRGDVALVEALVEDSSVSTKDCTAALGRAAKGNFFAIVSMIVDRRRIPKNAIKGAIETAVSEGYTEIFSKLIMHFYPDERGSLFYWGASKGQAAIVQLFLDNPSVVGRQYEVEKTLHNILHNCLRGGNPDIISMVIGHGSLGHSSKAQALRHAATNDLEAMVQRLIDLCNFSYEELSAALYLANQLDSVRASKILNEAMKRKRQGRL